MARTQYLSILVLIGLWLVGCSTPRVHSGSTRRARTPPPRAVPATKCDVAASLSIAIRGRIKSKDHDDDRQVWLLHERIVPEKQQSQRTGFGEKEEGWKEISWAQAARTGVRRSSPTVWLAHSTNRWVPMRIVRHWAVRSGDGALFTAVRAELAGDFEATKDSPSTTYAIRCSTPPTHLTWTWSKPVVVSAAKLQTWGLPISFVQALAPKSCQGPACRLKWKVSAVPLAEGGAVFEATVSHVYPTAQDRCSWKTKDSHGVFYRSGGGKPAMVLNGESLAAVLQGGGRLLAVVTNEDGRMQVFTPQAPGRLKLQSKITWDIPHEEEYTPHTLGPICGP